MDVALGLSLQPDPARWTLGRFLEDVVQRHGARAAFCFEGRTTSYDDLAREARALARGLIGAGVVKGAHVGLLVANRPEWAIGAFAADYYNQRLSQAWFRIDTLVDGADYARVFLPGFRLLLATALPAARMVLAEPLAAGLRSHGIE
jgi:non-ribosomal peptide synthetase component F